MTHEYILLDVHPLCFNLCQKPSTLKIYSSQLALLEIKELTQMPALRSYALNNEHQTALSTQKMKFQQLMENSPLSLMWNKERGYGGTTLSMEPPASQSARAQHTDAADFRTCVISRIIRTFRQSLRKNTRTHSCPQ